MNPMIIANTQIRRDIAGRYCLNDLHQASGGAVKHQPSKFTRSQQAQELVNEIAKDGEGLTISGEAPLVQVNDGFGNGTYAVKELVYAYAMWISAAFHLHVIRAYDALVQAEIVRLQATPAAQPMQHQADILVSADRIFGATLRMARRSKLSYAHAFRAAADITRERTGIDVMACLQMQPDDIEPAQVQGTAFGTTVGRVAGQALEAFYAQLASGELLGIDHGPALSTDVFALYHDWCVRRGLVPLNMVRMIPALERVSGVAVVRKRYMLDRAMGPHGVMFYQPRMWQPDQPEGDWLGEQIMAFRSASQRWSQAC